MGRLNCLEMVCKWWASILLNDLMRCPEIPLFLKTCLSCQLKIHFRTLCHHKNDLKNSFSICYIYIISIVDDTKLFSRIWGLLFQPIFPHLHWRWELDQYLQIDKLKYECDGHSGRLEDVSGRKDILDKQFGIARLCKLLQQVGTGNTV